MMKARHGWPGALLVLAACASAVGACGRLRLDDAPQIRGTLVAVDSSAIEIRHKTGQTYHVEVTPDTRIVNSSRPGDSAMCPGQRATVFLAAPRRFAASSITLWSGDCR